MAKLNFLRRAFGSLRRISLRQIGRGLRNVGVRGYALLLLLVLAWAGYLAVHYLIRTVFYPVEVPRQFVDWQGHLDTKALREDNIAGVTGAAARAPIAHFHKVDRWFQPDPHNACTADGCHEPLPHTKRAVQAASAPSGAPANRGGVAAFTNFHATFLTCQMCHQAAPSKPVSAGWVNLASGKFQDAPAILQLMRYFEDNAGKLKDDPAGAHAAIVPLLERTIQAIGSDRVLEDMLIMIQTAEPGSPVWKHAVDQLAADLPSHARGEYGAKLTRRDSDGIMPADQMQKETKAYFAARSSGERGQIDQRIHAGVLKQPDACENCHTKNAPLVDLAAAGYSPNRARYLTTGFLLAEIGRKLRQGENWYPPPTMEPSSQP